MELSERFPKSGYRFSDKKRDQTRQPVRQRPLRQARGKAKVHVPHETRAFLAGRSFYCRGREAKAFRLRRICGYGATGRLRRINTPFRPLARLDTSPEILWHSHI
jgi:hypothetical protein